VSASTRRTRGRGPRTEMLVHARGGEAQEIFLQRRTHAAPIHCLPEDQPRPMPCSLPVIRGAVQLLARGSPHHVSHCPEIGVRRVILACREIGVGFQIRGFGFRAWGSSVSGFGVQARGCRLHLAYLPVERLVSYRHAAS